PVNLSALNPARAAPTCVVAECVVLTFPVAGAVVSQARPEAVVIVAVQFSLCSQAPVAAMVTPCAAGSACPITPEKASATGETETAQAAWTTKLTGICCGLPAAGFSELSEPVIVMAPL